MANINEELVREFFEHNGFSVKLQRKYVLTGSEKNQLDQIDLLIYNTKFTRDTPLDSFVLTAQDLGSITRAAVGVRGWHSETFSPSVLQSSPELFYFAEVDPKVVSKVLFHDESFVNILVLPMLPQNEHVRNRSIEILKQNNISGVLEFRTVLRDLIEQVKTNKNYSESTVLQLLRMLKRYDLVKQYQLDLFDR